MDSPLKEVFAMLATRARLVGLQCLFNEKFLADKRALVVAVIIIQSSVIWSAPDIFFYSARFTNMTDAPKFLGNIFIGLLILAGISCLINLYVHQEPYREILKEMGDFHLSETEWVKPILKRNFERAAKRTRTVFIFLSVLVTYAFISFLVVGCFLDVVVQKPDFPLPSFYQMSFLPVQNWWTYALNFTQQALFALSAILNYQMIGATVFLISLCTIAKFDTLLEMINLQDKISSLDSFDEWFVACYQQMEDIRRNLLKFREVNKVWFYTQEKNCYYIILTSYLIFNIDLKMVGVCFSGLSIVTGITIAVLLNEMFFQKFHEVNKAIYDLSWYSMTPRQRRYIAMLLKSSQTSIVMSSAGITDLTLEWLGSVLKGGYSAGLVMKDFFTV